MLIMLPPSEGKRAPGRGRPLDLAALVLPELAPTRRQVIGAVADAATRPDAARLFGAGVGRLADVAANRTLAERPAARADQVYDGVLYRALDLATLTAPERRRATRYLLISSALFGVLRLADRIPDYKLSMSARLPMLGSGLAAAWRVALRDPLDRLAADRLVVDCRSGSYAAAWRPNRPDRWVAIVVPGATHAAKHTRGLVARELCRLGSAPHRPAELAESLAGAFRVRLEPPSGQSAPWRLAVSPR